MHSLEEILEQFKLTADYKRGYHYFEEARVGAIDLDEEGKLVRAEVEGSANKRYRVDIRFAAAKTRLGKPVLRGFCNCPVGFNCKHVFATLFTIQDELHEEAVAQLLPMGFDQYEGSPLDLGIDAHRTMTFGQPTAGQVAEATQSTTGPSVSIPARQIESGGANLSTLTPESAEHHGGLQIFYILEPIYSNPPVLEIHVGNFDHEPPIQMVQQVNVQGIISSRGRMPAVANGNDQILLMFAYEKNLLLTQKRKSTIKISDDVGGELLVGAMQTQRVYMRDRRSLLPVVLGPEREVMLDWEFNQKYQTRIQAFLAPTKATKAHIIELQPIAALPVQPPQLVLTPDAANTDTTLVAQLCPIANLDLAQVLQLRAQEFGYLERTATGFTYDPANINVTLLQQCAPFPVVTATEVTPIPMIHVSRVTFSDKRSFEILELEFDYDGFIVSAFSTANALCIRKLNVNATTEKVHYVKRLKDFEASFKKPLAEKMQIAHQELFQLSQELRHIKAFWFGERTSARYKSQWIELLSKHLPELEQLGAQLHIDKDIQFDFVEVDESTWYLELEPTEGHWFEMSLGFQVGDESINLMQVLLGQINQLPSQAELAELDPDEQIPVEIETGRFAFLKAGRLLQILSAFYELLESKSKPRMASYHAALVHKFADSFQDQPVQWRGSQQMRQLGEQLSQNGEIPPVAPAPSLNAVLREYQGYGLSWLQFLSVNCLNGILADDMGLGKTLQTLAHLQLHILERRSQTDPVALGPSLVVTPTSVVSNWSREASIFTPELEVVEYYGLHRHKIDIHAYDIVVTSYGIVRQDLDLFREANLYFIVLDEAQAIKNPTSKTAIAIKTIPSQHRLCLTGTPIENHLGELWSMFDFLMPGFLSSVRRFNKLYRKPIEDQGDKLQAKQLQQRIAPFILRRTKDVVAKDLPPKTEMIHSCTLTDQQRDLYETVRLSVSHSVQNAISQRGLAQSQIVILDGILKLRQICCHPQLLNLAQAQQLNQSAKLEELLELLEPLVEEGRSVLVFSSFASMLDLIAKRLEKHKLSYLMLTGKTRNRQDLVDRFQAGESPIFLISLKAGGTGLTLTQADTVIHYDPWWNPAVEDQATDRAYRIGQDKPVFVYKLITQGTIEQKMLALKERKQAIANSVYNPSDEQSTRLHFSLEDIENLFAPI